VSKLEQLYSNLGEFGNISINWKNWGRFQQTYSNLGNFKQILSNLGNSNTQTFHWSLDAIGNIWV